MVLEYKITMHENYSNYIYVHSYQFNKAMTYGACAHKNYMKLVITTIKCSTIALMLILL